MMQKHEKDKQNALKNVKFIHKKMRIETNILDANTYATLIEECLDSLTSFREDRTYCD